MASTAMAWPSTSHQFINRFPLHKTSTIQLLQKPLRNLSGSHWTREHLVACRVLILPVDEIPVLAPYMPNARATMETSEDVKDLTKLTPSTISRCNHAALRKQGGVFDSFYIALADVTRSPHFHSAASERPSRVSKVVSRPDFDPGIGLSSPTRASSDSSQESESQSDYKSSPPQARDFAVQQDRIKHEVVSSDLAAQFISSVLDLLVVHSNPRLSMEFAHAPKTFDLDFTNLECTSQNDGSIIWCSRTSMGQEWTSGASLCSLEAKAYYKEEDTSSGLGVVSDRVMAQQVCEMLGLVISRIDDEAHWLLDEKNRHSFLISIHQTNITLLHAEFSAEYLNYMYSEIQPAELPYLEIHQLDALNLEIPEDRKSAAEMIIALAAFLYDQENLPEL